MSEHTQLPWRVGSSRADGAINMVESATGYAAWCDFELGNDAANATFIVKSANAHDDLVKALSACVGYLLNAKIDLETGATKATAIKTIEGGIKQAREALAKVQS